MLKSSLFTFLLLFSPSLLIAETINLKMATSWQGGPIFEECAVAFAKKVEELSGSSIKIKAYQGGVLGSALQVTETVQRGVSELGHLYAGYDWGKDKAAVVLTGYAGGLLSEEMMHWLYYGGGKELLRAWRKEKFQLVAIPLCARSAEVFLHSKKPVRTLEDIQGLKLRTTGAWLEIAGSLGASPVTASAADVFPMLERGAVDALEWGTPWENKPVGLHKVAKYLVVPGVHQPSAFFELQISPAVWEKLSVQQKALIENAAQQVTFEYWLKDGVESAKALEYFRAEGNEILELDENIQMKVAELGQQWAQRIAAENEWAQKILESQQQFRTLWKTAARNVLLP